MPCSTAFRNCSPTCGRPGCGWRWPHRRPNRPHSASSGTSGWTSISRSSPVPAWTVCEPPRPRWWRTHSPRSNRCLIASSWSATARTTWRVPLHTASPPSWSTGATERPTSPSRPASPRLRMWRQSTTSARCWVSEPLHITFICSGNICRSPIAEKMFAHQISERGLTDDVRVTSAGTGDWHAGEGADNRANRVLREHGYPTEHRARRINEDHLSADLVVALGRNHERILRDMGVPTNRLRMLRSFDPKSGAHPHDVEDPYYGTHDDFEDVFTVIEASLPGLHEWVDEQLAGRGIAS